MDVITPDKLQYAARGAELRAGLGSVAAVCRGINDKLARAALFVDHFDRIEIERARQPRIAVAGGSAHQRRQRNDHVGIFDRAADQGLVAGVSAREIEIGIGAKMKERLLPELQIIDDVNRMPAAQEMLAENGTQVPRPARHQNFHAAIIRARQSDSSGEGAAFRAPSQPSSQNR